ncbi:rho GTPase-activating 20-like [Pelobates cultripes]|uniref:Rho GTPase-activating 20-like n=1 Tax=Pelobates cultripes TaxID=61616 RepID=A0AAD1SHL2_PELCU|nr:rho GTPase-activating 20-like [Pelobates cultripes]
MRASVQRRRSSSAITRALSKSKSNSREITLFPANSGNGLLLGAFCSPSNMLILKERVQLTNGWQTQERHLFLFNDSLVIAKSKHINEIKKNEYPKELPISVLYLDAEELTSSATINVTNMDDADKVIRMASEQLGIPGKPGDYHLWVISGKDEPSYPLYGHEHPFSIALHCFRESHEMPKGSNNNLFLDQGSETVIVEQLPRERHCQFVLRLRPQVHENAGRESVQKHSRRKKSLIDWALRRTGSTTLSSRVPQSPNTPRKLFGLSLSSICLNGNLPKPIMDMLMLLYEEGPNTKGIFRRSANAKTCKELKEKLISGNDVQIDRESVFVAAAVITKPAKQKRRSGAYRATAFSGWHSLLGGAPLESATTAPTQYRPETTNGTPTMRRRNQKASPGTGSDSKDISTMLQKQPQPEMVAEEGVVMSAPPESPNPRLCSNHKP